MNSRSITAGYGDDEWRAIVYVLFEVRQVEGDKFEFRTVYIAARTSAEAVKIWRRLSNFGSEPLAFVQSDDVRERDPMAAVRLAGNGTEVVSRAQYDQWVSIMTRDDERTPAAFVRVEALDRNAWIREVSDERLRGYARMLSSEGRYERRGDGFRSGASQQHFSRLITDEITRRGGEGELWKATAHRELDLGFEAAFRALEKRGGE